MVVNQKAAMTERGVDAFEFAARQSDYLKSAPCPQPFFQEFFSV
jgi:hypothetical protein